MKYISLLLLNQGQDIAGRPCHFEILLRKVRRQIVRCDAEAPLDLPQHTPGCQHQDVRRGLGILYLDPLRISSYVIVIRC